MNDTVAPPRDFEAGLAEWAMLRDRLAADKVREAQLRSQLFAAAFPEPREGVNNFRLLSGATFKGTYNYNRTVDPAQIPLVRDLLAQAGSNAPVDDYLSVRYELRDGEYKKATAEVRAILDRMLTLKPAMPRIDVVLPEVKA